jgi:hypothetical protein
MAEISVKDWNTVLSLQPLFIMPYFVLGGFIDMISANSKFVLKT